MTEKPSDGHLPDGRIVHDPKQDDHPGKPPDHAPIGIRICRRGMGLLCLKRFNRFNTMTILRLPDSDRSIHKGRERKIQRRQPIERDQ